jgi:hypothetical protein
MAISDMKEMSQLKEKCIVIRLQLIIGFNQLRAILASIKEESTEELKKELAKWLRYMNDLHIHSISVLNPESLLLFALKAFVILMISSCCYPIFQFIILYASSYIVYNLLLF